MFENRVLKNIFGLQREEVTGGWRTVGNEELQDLYSLQNITPRVKSRRIRCAGHVARMAERGGAYSVLVGRTDRK